MALPQPDPNTVILLLLTTVGILLGIAIPLPLF